MKVSYSISFNEMFEPNLPMKAHMGQKKVSKQVRMAKRSESQFNSRVGAPSNELDPEIKLLELKGIGNHTPKIKQTHCQSNRRSDSKPNQRKWGPFSGKEFGTTFVNPSGLSILDVVGSWARFWIASPEVCEHRFLWAASECPGMINVSNMSTYPYSAIASRGQLHLRHPPLTPPKARHHPEKMLSKKVFLEGPSIFSSATLKFALNWETVGPAADSSWSRTVCCPCMLMRFGRQLLRMHVSPVFGTAGLRFHRRQFRIVYVWNRYRLAKFGYF